MTARRAKGYGGGMEQRLLAGLANTLGTTGIEANEEYLSARLSASDLDDVRAYAEAREEHDLSRADVADVAAITDGFRELADHGLLDRAALG